jgi:hypothetical protein
VTWTGLCFDRKQFVAAFPAAGVSGPLTHTPAPRAKQRAERTSRRRPARARAESALNELYPNGVPDQISKSDAELVRSVEAKITKRRQQPVSRDTILRAAGRRK